MSRYLFNTEGGQFSLPIERLSVNRCLVDHALTLEFAGSEGLLSLRIEGPFSLTESHTITELDPARPRELGPAIALFGATVKCSRVTADGLLEIQFTDMRSLSVQSQEGFEAWELVGPRGLRAVCLPGGGVSTWGQPAT